jgi:hypothetical protein
MCNTTDAYMLMPANVLNLKPLVLTIHSLWPWPSCYLSKGSPPHVKPFGELFGVRESGPSLRVKWVKSLDMDCHFAYSKIEWTTLQINGIHAWFCWVIHFVSKFDFVIVEFCRVYNKT